MCLVRYDDHNHHQMAGVFNHRKKSRSTDESFMNKPCSGWLHAADMLSSDRGVQYTIRVRM